MSTTDNAPDSDRDGGGTSFGDFFDEERLMVRVPVPLFDTLRRSDDLLLMRDWLKAWFLTYGSEIGSSPQMIAFYDELDTFLGDLVKPVLHREFLNSHNNNSTDSKQ